MKIVGKLGGEGRAVLGPKFRGVKGTVIDLRTRGGKSTVTIVGRVREPLKKQVRIAEKTVTAVSAQADKIINLIKTKRVVRKPIPDEANLPKRIKVLLKKFDQGKINKKELIRLQSEVPLLERSFFADPRGRLRPSRFGRKQKEASLLDILSGDFTFRAPKPQALVFSNVKVQKFPKSLKDVEDALKSGKTLTTSQGKRLLAFQLKKSGKFKPVGALSREPEITLAPGEIIKRVKRVGTIKLSDGRLVPIIQAKVVKATATTKKLQSKAKAGKITTKELKILERRLTKESGFKASASRRTTAVKPRARLPKRIPRRAPRRVSRRAPRRPLKRQPSRPPRRGRRRALTRAVRRTPTRQPRRRLTSTTRRAPVIRVGRGRARPPLPLPRIKRKKEKLIVRKVRGGFNVFARPLKKRGAKRRPPLIKINRVALTRRKAIDLRNHILDTSLARTGRIKRTKGRARSPRLRVSSVSISRKFRKFRIKNGKRIPLVPGKVIEKTKNLLDTRQEKRKITLKRRIAQLSRQAPPPRRATRRVSLAQRKILITRLKKARAVKRRLRRNR